MMPGDGGIKQFPNHRIATQSFSQPTIMDIKKHLAQFPMPPALINPLSQHLAKCITDLAKIMQGHKQDQSIAQGR